MYDDDHESYPKLFTALQDIIIDQDVLTKELDLAKILDCKPKVVVSPCTSDF
jgi:hypothetical protein